jgi:ubiquinone/menaquinone biosynthesis C-methylase UbiE
MQGVSERERFLRAFHDARPGVTSGALARAGSYERLAAKVPQGRVLDLSCGDGSLLELLPPGAIGLDLSLGELQAARERVRARARVTCTSTSTIEPRLVQARAQELPFADACFDAVTCHLAFMLFDDIEQVVSELVRVIKPGGQFIALLGGGPTADGDDAFHRFARLLSQSKSAGPELDIFRGIGDRRASSEAGWRELFAGWRDLTFERWPLDLGGTFDEVWTFLASSYQLRDSDRKHIRDHLRAAFPNDPVPCTVVAFCATVTR